MAAVVIPETDDVTDVYPDGWVPDVEIHTWLLDGAAVLHAARQGWRLDDPQPGLDAIRNYRHELADTFHPAWILTT